MATNFTHAVNNARLNAITTAASTAATLKLYNGTAPTNADTAIGAQTLLATLTFAAGLAGAAASSSMSLLTVNSATAVATGVCNFARVATSGGTALLDLTSVGTSGSDLNLNSTTINSGGTVSVTSGTIAEQYP